MGSLCTRKLILNKNPGGIIRVYCRTINDGCTINLLETSAYRKSLISSGCVLVNEPHDADILIFNTCAYSNESEDRSISVIKQHKAIFHDKRIIITGCLPPINPSRVISDLGEITVKARDIDDLHIKVGISPPNATFFNYHLLDSQDLNKLSPIRRRLISSRKMFNSFEKIFPFSLPKLRNILDTGTSNETFYYITISTGCLGSCAYCAIKNAKGHLVSRNKDDIMNEFHQALNSNLKNIWLISDDNGCWGQDIDDNFADLLQTMLAVDDDFKIVINYLGPAWLEKYYSKFKNLLSDKRIIAVDIPMQSGSARVIQKMRRNYDPFSIVQKIIEIKKSNPDLILKTSIIVGFPGESLLDFIKTFRYLTVFEVIMLLKFSQRPNTAAFYFKHQISPTIKNIRYVIMNAAVFVRHLVLIFFSFFIIRKKCSVFDHDNKTSYRF